MAEKGNPKKVNFHASDFQADKFKEDEDYYAETFSEFELVAFSFGKCTLQDRGN